jgi:hypothetical protein
MIGQSKAKFSLVVPNDVDAISHRGGKDWLRGLDLNQRPSGYEPDELPDCSTPRTEDNLVSVLRNEKSARDGRIRPRSNDTLSTMKALFSVILAFAVCAGSVQAGPVRTARHVAKNTAITAKNVAHSVVKGTRRAVHTVVYNLTP